MSNTKRLFLFAGYSSTKIVDDALVYYVRALSKLGDIVLVLDSDCSDSELKKVNQYCLYANATRHGEYDFGSYKRAFAWAKNNLNLDNYDFVYMVNDSVYGPMFDLGPYLTKMEDFNTDAFGLVENPKKSHPHIQSWFIGMRKNVFMSDWFEKFISGVAHHDNKGEITSLYEHGFSIRVIDNGGEWKCMYSVPGRGVYNQVKKLYRKKMPFMKKVAFTRHDGGLSTQIKYVLKRLPKNLTSNIISSASISYGEQYINKILARGWMTTKWHNLKYGIKKLLRGQL